MEERPHPKLHVESLESRNLCKSRQRQSNGYDCGVSAIAFATSLANGEEPENRLYNTKKLCAHLMDGLVSGTLTPFPSDPIRAKTSMEIVQEEELLSPNRIGEKGVGAHRIEHKGL
jgi:hypothetical protein